MRTGRVWTLVVATVLFGVMVLVLASRLGCSGARVPATTVLVLDVPTQLEEAETPFDPWDLDLVRWRRPILVRLVRGIDRAAKDDRVAGLVLHVGQVDWGWAKLTEVRDALLRFAATGKPLHATLGGGGEAEYFLASAARWISMPPTAVLQLDGLSQSVMFLGGTFQKLDIRPNFASAGRFKSAVESYTRTGMSSEARLALESLLDDTYRLMVDSLAVARGFSASEIQKLLDRGPYGGEAALASGWVDSLVYAAEADSLVLREFGEHAKLLEFRDYLDRSSAPMVGPRIAMITLAGTIESGRSRFVPDQGYLAGAESLVEALEEARIRRSIQAVVLRIDSPGGEISASDEVWRAVAACRDEKPVIVSMSDVAASGGYYAAVAGDRIVAQPMTVTGSIGVFGGKLNLLGLYRKLGLNVETIARGRRAEMMSPFTDFTEEEAQVFSSQLDDAYGTFLHRVARGRSLSQSATDSVAQGRVWSGLAAWQRGLVDTLGGLETAFAIALEESGHDRDAAFTVEILPKVEHPFIERMIGDWFGNRGARSRSEISRVLEMADAASRVPAGVALALMPYTLRIR